MRVWIGCLASYNNGRLHGEWFDVSEDADENEANTAKVLRSSPCPNITKTDPETGETYRTAEEAFCADYEAPEALVRILGEYPGADMLAHAARLESALETQWPDEDEAAAVLGVMLDGQSASDLEELADGFEDWASERFAGEGDTLADWCAEFLDETGFFDLASPERGSAAHDRDRVETLQRYFNFEAYARDMELAGDVTSERVGGKVLVFWNR